MVLSNIFETIIRTMFMIKFCEEAHSDRVVTDYLTSKIGLIRLSKKILRDLYVRAYASFINIF